MKWIDPKDELPPQGKKILYFKEGDIYVVQRFDDLWVPIPFVDSEYTFYDAPHLWADIIPPIGFTGKMHIITKNMKNPVDIDELQMFDPETYDDFIEYIRNYWKKSAK